MRVGFRIAPGVRISASSRGVRLGVGPRIARVHVGGGRTAVSSGLGPMTVYTPLGARQRRAQRARAVGTPGPSASQLAAEQRAGEAAAAWEQLQEILAIHREEFELNPSPRHWQPLGMDEQQVHAYHRARCSRGVPPRDRARLAEAQRRADQIAAAEIATVRQIEAHGFPLLQAAVQPTWDRLAAGDPDLVLRALTLAFEDNVATAVPVDVDGDAVSVLVLLPGEDALPERWPSTTSTGAPTTRKASVAQRAGLYRDLVFGHLVVTVKEAFAVAPGLRTARVVGLRDGGVDAFGDRRTDVLVAVEFSRDDFARIRWADASAADVVRDAGRNLTVREKGAAKALQPLDVTADPALSAAVAAVSFDG